MATNGDLELATSEDFSMATDKRVTILSPRIDSTRSNTSQDAASA
jgi:hypothetical protein